MAMVEGGPKSNPLIERVKNILFSPQSEWERIEAEPATVQGLYTGYACILAAIGPVAWLIGSQVFGWGGFLARLRPPLVSAVARALFEYAANLAGVYVLAIVIDKLAPRFDATPDRLKALKVAIYSCTAAWVAGVFGLFPPIAALSIIGVYSFYLLYLGAPKLMKAPQEKAVAYTVTIVVTGMVLELVIAVLAARIANIGL
jgi:hypothetical protein